MSEFHAHWEFKDHSEISFILSFSSSPFFSPHDWQLWGAKIRGLQLCPSSSEPKFTQTRVYRRFADTTPRIKSAEVSRWLLHVDFVSISTFILSKHKIIKPGFRALSRYIGENFLTKNNYGSFRLHELLLFDKAAAVLRMAKWEPYALSMVGVDYKYWPIARGNTLTSPFFDGRKIYT